MHPSLHPSLPPSDLREARLALLRVICATPFPSGEAPRIWVASVEALRRIEDELGMEHTIPTRQARRTALY